MHRILCETSAETNNALYTLIPCKHKRQNKHPDAASVVYGYKAYVRESSATLLLHLSRYIYYISWPIHIRII